jgi:hypothetical protein
MDEFTWARLIAGGAHRISLAENVIAVQEARYAKSDRREP